MTVTRARTHGASNAPQAITQEDRVIAKILLQESSTNKKQDVDKLDKQTVQYHKKIDEINAQVITLTQQMDDMKASAEAQLNDMNASMNGGQGPRATASAGRQQRLRAQNQRALLANKTRLQSPLLEMERSFAGCPRNVCPADELAELGIRNGELSPMEDSRDAEIDAAADHGEPDTDRTEPEEKKAR